MTQLRHGNIDATPVRDSGSLPIMHLQIFSILFISLLCTIRVVISWQSLKVVVFEPVDFTVLPTFIQVFSLVHLIL